MAAAMLASRAGADSGDTETATQPLLPHMLSQDELQLFKAADKGDFLQVRAPDQSACGLGAGGGGGGGVNLCPAAPCCAGILGEAHISTC